MKILVTASGHGLEAEVDQRFARCDCFSIIDTETMECTSIDNDSSYASGGAGTLAGQVVAGKGVEAVVTGHCGPNAVQVLKAAGIKIYTGAAGTVKDSVERFTSGALQEIVTNDVPGHYGSGAGRGGGRGRGRMRF